MMSQHYNSIDEIQLSVIVLFYHGESWLQPCMQSLQKQSLARSAYEIIMVDNGGSTPSVDNYAGQPNIKVLHFSKNYGFAGGNNRALAHAVGQIILLMNQDVIVHFNCLEELITSFKKNKQAGVISANMFMVSTKDRLDRHAPPPEKVGHYRISPFGYAAYVVRKAESEMIPVEFISGNGMCFQKKLLADVGNYLFDARLKSYAEDLDLCIRLKGTKWSLYVRPQAVIYHYRDEAFSGHPLVLFKKFIHISTNRLLVYKKNLLFGRFLIKLPLILLGIPLKVARPDGSSKFHLLNFCAALLLIPAVLANFSLKMFGISKS
jgi:GT2 family glycosyltransferase